MGDDHRELKRALRRAFMGYQAGQGQQVPDSVSRSACDRLALLRSVRSASALVAYSAIGGEVDLTAALDQLDGRSTYWPRVAGEGLEFCAAGASDLRPTGPYGLLEPVRGARLEGSGERVVFLVPGVAFDPTGVRLGRGAGLYDRALANFPSAVRIGVTCEARLSAVLPVDRWDVPMHLVVTEARLLGRGTARSMRKEMDR